MCVGIKRQGQKSGGRNQEVWNPTKKSRGGPLFVESKFNVRFLPRGVGDVFHQGECGGFGDLLDVEGAGGIADVAGAIQDVGGGGLAEDLGIFQADGGGLDVGDGRLSGAGDFGDVDLAGGNQDFDGDVGDFVQGGAFSVGDAGAFGGEVGEWFVADDVGSDALINQGGAGQRGGVGQRGVRRHGQSVCQRVWEQPWWCCGNCF